MAYEHEDDNLSHLISIWPICSSIATNLPVGDLISLSRSSKALRSYTHGFASNTLPDISNPKDHASDIYLGEHQTPHWKNLKTLSPFVCSFPYHKEPKSAKTNSCRACKFCSRPICKTCIVRSFFTDPKSSKLTYKHRARHLCSKCWSEGNLRRDYRFTGNVVTREQIWRGRDYAQRGTWCGCSASDDNWVCGECRTLQNSSGVLNLPVSIATPEQSELAILTLGDSESPTVRCYGLDCTNVISEIDRDRRRICLWCSKPLMRPYGGDDRLRWEEKQIEARAAAAASRSADMLEYNRNRFRNLTMSRREMRGTQACIELTGRDGPEHDLPIFVRHLDTINYRKYMSGRAAPSGDQVYASKHGRWTYSRACLVRFNQAVDRVDRAAKHPLPSGTDLKTIFDLNMEVGLPGARTNASQHFSRDHEPVGWILRNGTQLQYAGLADQECITWLLNKRNESESVISSFRDRLLMYLDIWGNLPEEEQISWKAPSFWKLAEDSGLSLPREQSTSIGSTSSRNAKFHGSLDSTGATHHSQENTTAKAEPARFADNWDDDFLSSESSTEDEDDDLDKNAGKKSAPTTLKDTEIIDPTNNDNLTLHQSTDLQILDTNPLTDNEVDLEIQAEQVERDLEDKRKRDDRIREL